jgi:hypothetical protein
MPGFGQLDQQPNLVVEDTMSFIRTSLMPLGAACLLVGAVACSDSSSPTTAPALSKAQADSVAEVVTVDASEVIEASGFNMTTGLALAPPMGAPPLSCMPAITPFPPTNSDEDIVPDSVRFQYTNCSFTRGVMTHTLDGTIDVIDPTPTVSDLDIRTTFTNFSRTLFNSATDRTVSALFDGTRELAATPDTLGVTMTDFLTAFTFANGATGSHLKNWTAKFTADVPGSISLGNPLPAGLLTITGSSSWTRLDQSWTIATTTPTALHFTPACTVSPRFDDGVLVHVVTRGDATATFQVTFTACGTYTVTRL